MKTLNISFDDKEFKQLEELKNDTELSWKDFIFESVGLKKRAKK